MYKVPQQLMLYGKDASVMLIAIGAGTV